MTKNSESGHIRNVTNFESLISFITSSGVDYKPAKPSLSLEAMQSLFTTAKNALTGLKQAESECATATFERKRLFDTLSPRITRVYSALRSSDSAKEADESALHLVRKLRGQRVSALLTDEEKTALEAEGKSVRQISSSQMSFDTRLDNFDKLVHLLSAIPQYVPNEADLSIDGLRAFYNELSARNTAVIDAEGKLEAARTHRFNVLYSPLNGLVDVGTDSKTYIKAIGGASSPLYKKVTKLIFRNYKK